MLNYFLVGMKGFFSFGVYTIVSIILVSISLIIVLRRLCITMQSGGSFFSSYKISNGFFYIHSGIVPGKRKILLKNISNVTIYLIRGIKGNGDRYHIMFEMRKGRNTGFFIGKSKRTENEIIEMKNQLKKNNVKIYYQDFTKK